MPHQEVAERMGLNTETVTKRWQRLRKKLTDSGLPEMLVGEAS